MKQLLSVAVLIIYFCTTTGFVISMHYCMERFESAGMNPVQTGKCSKCGMEKKDGCCRDNVKVVKLQTLHLTPKTFAANAQGTVVPACTTEYILSPLNNFFSKHPFIAGSPPKNEQDNWLQNRVLRI